MKKRMMIAGVLAATGGAGSAALAADVYDDSGSWYVDGMGQYTVLDDRRVSKDDFGYQIGIGKNFVPYFAAELNASIGSFNISHSGADQKLNAYSLDFLYKPLPQYIIQPYVLVGGGEMDDSVGGHTTPYHSGLAEAGLGVLAGLGSQTGSTRLQFRVEGKYRIEFISSNEYGPQQPGDVLLSAGLQLSWGNRRLTAMMIWMACPTRSIGVRTRQRATRSTPTAARSRTRSSSRASILPPTPRISSPNPITC